MKALGEKVHLTGQAAKNRVLKLEEEGLLKPIPFQLTGGHSRTSKHFYSSLPEVMIMNRFYRFSIKRKKSKTCLK